MAYYVYLLANDKYGTLYVGITNDIVRRVYSTKASLSRVSPSDIRSTN
jgi:putative endonuclease